MLLGFKPLVEQSEYIRGFWRLRWTFITFFWHFKESVNKKNLQIQLDVAAANLEIKI